MESHPAWPVIVQHPAFRDEQQIICTLLCLCKELASVVVAKLEGQISISFQATSPEQELQFAHWMSIHQALVSKSLSLRLWCQPEIILERESDDEEGPQQRQASPQQASPCCSSCAVLQQLPHHLSSLELHSDHYADLASSSKAMAALAGLKSLQALKLTSSVNTVCAAQLLQALNPLTTLTSLYVDRVVSQAKLKYLPASLQQLHLGSCSPGLQLGHLTALTSLCNGDKLLPLQPNAVLPSSLRSLALGECHSVQRLVELKHLQDLVIGASNIPARRLQRLARSLTNLQSVQLRYSSGYNEAAAAWGELPLQHLELQIDALSKSVISAATVQELCKLTGLTYLHIQRVDCLETTAQGLAMVLQQLTRLRGLKLWSSGPWPLLQEGPSAAAVSSNGSSSSSNGILLGSGLPQPAANDLAAAADSSPGYVAVMHAIAGLPHLSTVSLSLHNLGQTAAVQLAAATQLTSLKLRACGLDDTTLRALACSLTGLRSLFAEYNRDITDRALPLFRSQLLQLTELDIRYTAVSDAGKQMLRTLERLKQLQV